MTSYDRIEYPSYVLPQTYPDKIAVVAAMLGMHPASPAKARVLDVGCGAGGNLLPMALLWPGCECIGIDLASSAIDKAKTTAAQLGLKNARFECVDLLELPHSYGPFDYIIAHGFVSWVPPAVRERLFELCHERLSPQGIAYISFNAYPGCHVRDMFREIMQYHTQGLTDPRERADAARSLVETIAESGINSDAIQELARWERDIICRKSIGSLMHDDLSDDFQSFYFYEFNSLAARHGLQYLGEAVYNEGQPPSNLTAEANELLEHARQRGLVEYEQYQDFLKLRRFRQCIIAHADAMLDRAHAAANAMPRFHFASPLARIATPDGVEFSNQATKASAVTANPFIIGALDRIGHAWPSTVAFDQLLGTDAEQVADLCARLERFFAAGVIDVHAMPRVCASRPSERPEMWSYARLQAESERVTTPLTLNGVALDDPSVRQLIRLADGTRTVDELATQFGDRPGVERALLSAARMGFLVR